MKRKTQINLWVVLGERDRERGGGMVYRNQSLHLPICCDADELSLCRSHGTIAVFNTILSSQCLFTHASSPWKLGSPNVAKHAQSKDRKHFSVRHDGYDVCLNCVKWKRVYHHSDCTVWFLFYC